MSSAERITKIASLIRTAIGFPTEEALKSYLKKHPKADRSNHWVESSPERKPEVKNQKLTEVPEKIGRGDDVIDVTKSLVRGETPDRFGNYNWYDYSGKKVEDDAAVFRANRLARELSVLNPEMTGVRVFTDFRKGSRKPYAMVYSDTWQKQKGSAPFKYFYTEEQSKSSNALIMKKNIEFSRKFKDLAPVILEDAEKGNAEAVVCRIIMRHHIRVGTKGQKNDGICTMRARFLKTDGDVVVIKNMPVKSNKKYSGVIKDPVLVAEIKKRLVGKGPNDLIFADTDDKKVNQYIKSRFGDPSFSSKNFRTCEATGLAMKHVLDNVYRDGKKQNLDLRQRYAVMQKACEIASKALNNNPDVCHSNYIDPAVWNILDLPDSDYHKDYPIIAEKDGVPVFKRDAKIEKAESALRQGADDESFSVWDGYSSEKEEFLSRINEEREKEGYGRIDKLPVVHAAWLLKKWASIKKGG